MLYWFIRKEKDEMISMDESNPLFSLREESTESRVGRLYKDMRKMIIDGSLPAGYVFPNENEACLQLAIGRSTLREAYQALSLDGLIQRKRTGTVVNDIKEILETGPFNVAVELASFRDLYEFRLMLESESARYAADRAEPKEIQKLGEILSEIRRSKDDAERRRFGLCFHKSLVLFSHNALLINVFANAWNSFETLLIAKIGTAADGQEEELAQHEKIYAAVCAHDAEAAKQYMIAHIRNIYSGRD